MLRSNYSLKCGTQPILNISHTDNHLISQERTGIKIWDLNKSGYSKKCEIDLNYNGFGRACVSSDKNLLFAPKDSVDISIIDLNDGNETQLLKPNETEKTLSQVASMKLVTLNDELYCLAGYDSGDLLLWDLRMNRILSEIKFDFPILTIDYDSVTNRGLVGGNSSHICIFSFVRNTCELQKKSDFIDVYSVKDMKNKESVGIQCIKIRPDKKLFTCGSWDGNAIIYSWKSMRKLATLKEHRAEITDIAFSDCSISMFKSPIMFISSMDGSVSLWDVYYK